jgi:single-stranded-DNA-specific exonuclease
VGVLGVVASKIAEEHKKPVFVWGADGSDDLKGSCRSWGGINLVEVMSSLPENSLIDFGGHALAGGFSVSHEEIHFLEERIIKAIGDMECVEEEAAKEGAEATISMDDVTLKNFSIIEKLAPYGVGNPKPRFLFKEISVYSVKEFGKENNHLELSFLNSKGKQIKAIAFFKTRESFGGTISAGSKINLIASFEKNTFGGKNELRLRIIDIL